MSNALTPDTRFLEAGSAGHFAPKSGQFPFVGVVTPVRNRSNWTTGFVQRFARQDYPIFRHYIVDSASTDGTPSAVKALGLSAVEVLHAPSSSYWTAATNLGVRKALADGCDFILTINDDAVISEDLLSRIVEATLAGDAKMVGSAICYAQTPDILWGVGACNDFENGSFVQTRWANLPEETLRTTKRENGGLLKADYLCGNGTLVHRSVFEAIGLYDERYTPHYHADTELTMRAERAGIPRFVAPEARVYNRFTDDLDGPMSPKNRRFFSMRSANYIKPIIFILERYCRPEWRVRAFLSYLSMHLPRLNRRQRSMVLRMAVYLASPARQSSLRSQLNPQGDPHQAFLTDMALLQELSDTDFALVAYAYFVNRILAVADRRSVMERIKIRQGRRNVLSSLAMNPVFFDRDPDFAAFCSLAVNPVRLRDRDLAAECWSPAQRQALERVMASRGMLDSLRATLDDMMAGAQQFLLGQKARQSGNTPVQPRTPASPRHSAASKDAVTVYFNLDVLCMAQLDPKAATGVYRYASSVLEQFLNDTRLTVRTFYSTSLKGGYARWVAEKPGRSDLLAPTTIESGTKGVVFYPFFAVQESDARFFGLPTALTICDLFPLTNPEWFSDEAVENFRRQLHFLPNIDHFFCISQATQTQLHATFPSLRASSSVTLLAASPPATTQPPKAVLPARFFLCVGTIEPRKNLKTVIEAFASLPPGDMDDVHMVVAGQEGWRLSEADLQALAKDKINSIHFLGRLTDEELHYCYSRAEFLVFASLAEGFGLPIVEAFMHGTPVITSNNSSMLEIGGVGVLLVDPLDKASIAEAIRALATDSGQRADYSAKARGHAGQFSWQRCAGAHVSDFLRLAGTPKMAITKDS